MSFLGKLGLINEAEVEEKTTEENPSDNNQEVKNTTPKAENKKSTISFVPPTVTNPGQVVGKLDKEIFEKLSLAIEENNLNGNDFLEFMQSLNKLQNLTVDEKTKFNMVFATLSTSSGGMNKEVLLNSIDHYMKVIESEKNVFGNEMGKATTEMVDEKESYIEQLSKSAQEKAEQIQKLTQEIQEINNEVASVKTEVAQSKVSIAQKQADFDVSVQQLEGQINDYKTKIEQYIQ